MLGCLLPDSHPLPNRDSTVTCFFFSSIFLFLPFHPHPNPLLSSFHPPFHPVSSRSSLLYKQCLVSINLLHFVLCILSCSSVILLHWFLSLLHSVLCSALFSLLCSASFSASFSALLCFILSTLLCFILSASHSLCFVLSLYLSMSLCM